MLYIGFEGSDEGSLEWHIGEPIAIDLDFENVQFVQADGEELEYIRRNFSNLPMATNKHAPRWFGDLAKLIVANL